MKKKTRSGRLLGKLHGKNWPKGRKVTGYSVLRGGGVAGPQVVLLIRIRIQALCGSGSTHENKG